MFMTVGPSTFTCQQCKCTTVYKFNPVFLAYDTNCRTCSICKTKIEKAAEAQKVIDRDKAFIAFADKSKAMIQSAISISGVPAVFQSADMSDLGAVAAKVRDVSQSYFIRGDVGVGK
jgi:hypothetical protein